jgi:ubiquinone/menaquinone biosynthesis C-methylase UbiE
MQTNKRIKEEKKYWDKLAPDYDQFIEKTWKVYASLLIDKISQDVKGDIVLDVAAGTGLVALKVAERASKVYGIDISEPMIEEAKKKAKEMGIKNVEFSVNDAYALPFDNDMFDTVICNNALHNMKEPQKALSEIRRVLKQGCRLIAPIVGIGESLNFKIVLNIVRFFTGFPVFYKLNLDEAETMISKAGFYVLKKEIIKHPQDRMPLLYIVGKYE